MQILRVLACCGLLLPTCAVAQPAPPEAQAVQDSLQSWLTGLLGPTLGAQLPKLRVEQQDDHLRVILPVPLAGEPAEMTADIHPLDAGRWSVDAVHFPQTGSFSLDLPEAGANHPVPTTLVFRIGTQDTHAQIDPLLATLSSLNMGLGDIDLASDSADRHQEQHIDRYALAATLAPRGDRLDLAGKSTLSGWRMASRAGKGPAMAIGADRIDSSGKLAGIDRQRGYRLLAALAGFVTTLPDSQSGAPLPPAARAALRALIVASRGAIDSLQGEESIQGLHIAMAGEGEAVVKRVRFAMDGAAPDGILHATFDIDMDGLMARDTPANVLGLMPQHVMLRPSIAGVSLAGLTALMLQATEPGADDAHLHNDAEALLHQRPVTLGLDELDMDVGPAVLRGHGRLVLSGPDGYRLEAHLTATGLDALIEQARSNRDLQHALPMLALMRGFARPDGNKLAWDIVADNGALMLNGIPFGAPQAGHDHPDRR